MKIELSCHATASRAMISRRTFVTATAALAVAQCARRPATALNARRTLAYVGTDTTPVDGTANGKGISLFEVHPDTGGLLFIKVVANSPNATWITFHPSGKYLYAGNEIADFDGKNGSVSSFAIDSTNGDLHFLNSVSSHGASPAYVSIDAEGKYAFVANYFGGSIAVLPILPDGSLGSAVNFHEDEGHLGTLNGSSSPPGSFAISGHDGPHAHIILPDPKNRFVLQTDLGQDRIYVYRFDSGNGKLTPASVPFVSLPSGDGPRHLAFHPNGHWMYSIQEESSTIAFFLYDPETGALQSQQTISTLPQGFTGTNFSSEITVAASGRFLYAANRLHNSIAAFAIGPGGHLRNIGDTPTLGDYPSHFSIGPNGNFLYVCNQRSDQITSFRIDRASGKLSFTGQYTPIGTPMCIAFSS